MVRSRAAYFQFLLLLIGVIGQVNALMVYSGPNAIFGPPMSGVLPGLSVSAPTPWFANTAPQSIQYGMQQQSPFIPQLVAMPQLEAQMQQMEQIQHMQQMQQQQQLQNLQLQQMQLGNLQNPQPAFSNLVAQELGPPFPGGQLTSMLPEMQSNFIAGSAPAPARCPCKDEASSPNDNVSTVKSLDVSNGTANDKNPMFVDLCHIAKVVVNQDHPSDSGTGGMSLADVTAIYGGGGAGGLTADQRGRVVLGEVHKTSLMCLDDRLTEPSMSTPGGDLGEFALALSSYQKLKGDKQMSQALVDSLLLQYIGTLPGDRRLVHCTDERALRHLETTLPAENLDLRSPPWHAKEAGLLDRLTEVDNQGDSHFRLMLKQPEWYELSKDLTPMVLKSFYKLLWQQHQDSTSSLYKTPRLHLQVLTGQSSPQAFFEVSSCAACQEHGIAPMLTPRNEHRAVLVSHLDAASTRREELATFFSRAASATPIKIDREKLHTRLNRHGWLALETTGSRIAAGLPFYTLDYV